MKIDARVKAAVERGQIGWGFVVDYEGGTMRSVKHGRKKGRRRINYSKNLTAAKKKAIKKRKTMDGITCKQMRIAWDKNATIKQNMKAMGLAYDSNKLFSLHPSISKHTEEMEIDDPKQYGSLKSQIQKAKSTSGKPEVKKVIAALEKEVEDEEIRQKKGRTYRLLAKDIEFCIYMIEKHGDNYEAGIFR
ncbi:ribosome biogenesis protein Nop16 [Onchocerca flexuosa]|uniref:Nucleolar protein 16 n=1 Tax=Onchocerca flexuosa TaxID=387005 RepID=A0A238C078_9BILA|nr:ribosome biogenesis protein Nop16 [Onchocerca flexuosa]